MLPQSKVFRLCHFGIATVSASKRLSLCLFPRSDLFSGCRRMSLVGFKTWREEQRPLALSSLYSSAVRQISVSRGPHFSSMRRMDAPKPPSTRSLRTQKLRSGLDLKVAASACA
ncbi:hypothetical protein BD626DRAFT_485690 [Schizophyllum amplum]|uniref:Uncharacterized protein n=1 Tax=Schizophyllum amplum TaxID=97359 RepID=A0A550CLV7_9AGAR|nr:hypothetical protein BD626DRAFT_485690 [Auriculariopsis ampla]